MNRESSGDSELDRVDIHDVLSNERRLIALAYLQRGDGKSTPSELAERIATVETGEDPPPDRARQSALVTLHQTHLPKLTDLGIVEYVEDTKTVRLTDRASQVNVFIEAVPRYGISWAEFYLIVSLLGLLLMLASLIGVPAISVVGAASWAAGTFILLFSSAAYHSIKQGSPMIERLREFRN